MGVGAKYDWIIGQNFDLIPSPDSIAKPVYTGPKNLDSGDLGFSQAPRAFPWGYPHDEFTRGFGGPISGGVNHPALDSQGLGLSSSEVTSGSMSFSFTFSVRSLKSLTSSWSRSLMMALFWLAAEAARSWPLWTHHPTRSGPDGKGPRAPREEPNGICPPPPPPEGCKSCPSFLLTPETSNPF